MRLLDTHDSELDRDLTDAWLNIVEELDADPAAVEAWIRRLTPDLTGGAEEDTLTLPEHYEQ